MMKLLPVNTSQEGIRAYLLECNNVLLSMILFRMRHRYYCIRQRGNLYKLRSHKLVYIDQPGTLFSRHQHTHNIEDRQLMCKLIVKLMYQCLPTYHRDMPRIQNFLQHYKFQYHMVASHRCWRILCIHNLLRNQYNQKQEMHQ